LVNNTNSTEMHGQQNIKSSVFRWQSLFRHGIFAYQHQKSINWATNWTIIYLGQVKISLSSVSPEGNRFFRLRRQYRVPIHKQLDEATKENYEVEHPEIYRRSHPLPNARFWTCEQDSINCDTRYRPYVSMLFIMENMSDEKLKYWTWYSASFVYSTVHMSVFILTSLYTLHT
jgi:hypothetical protein